MANKAKSAQQYIDSRLRFTALSKAETACLYYDRYNKRKPCKMTTQKKCLGCRFYVPNHAVRAEAVAEHLRKMDKKQSELTNRLYNAELMIESMTLRIKHLTKEVEEFTGVIELIKEELENDSTEV